jgi:hypothetical protein
MSADLHIPVTAEMIDAIADQVATRLAERRRWAEIGAVADYLGVPISRVRYLRSIGLPARRVGRRLLFDLREVDGFLEGLERV